MYICFACVHLLFQCHWMLILGSIWIVLFLDRRVLEKEISKIWVQRVISLFVLLSKARAWLLPKGESFSSFPKKEEAKKEQIQNFPRSSLTL